MTCQTNTNKKNVDNDMLEEEFVENKNYLIDQHHNNINNNNNTKNIRHHHLNHNDTNNSNNQSISRPRSLILIVTSLLPHEHNKESPAVVNGTLVDNDENLNKAVYVESI